MTYNWATYQSAKGCTHYGPAGAQALLVYLEDRFPDQQSFGICNCRNTSGGSWSHHAECRAYDEGFKAVFGQRIGIETLELLGPHGAELGIDHLIMNHRPGDYNRGDPRIYSARSPQGRTYTGTHPHKNHDHIGLTRNAGLHLTYAKLELVLGPAKQLGDDDEMSLLGFDIGKIGAPSVKGLKAGTLQAMLNDRGAKLEVDQRAGNLTRAALHDWKIEAAITAAFSAGSGKIGQYEYAALHEPMFNEAIVSHKDADHATLATQRELDRLEEKISDQAREIRMARAGLSNHTGMVQTGPHSPQ